MEYKLCRYFDDYLEAVESTHLTKEEANKALVEIEKKGGSRCYVSYQVRQEEPKQ